jgi:hypothetical protein
VSIHESGPRGRGRPLKFGRPARSVTITLPDDVLAALRTRNRDIGRAIVGLLAGASSTARPAQRVVLHQTGRRAVIVVSPVEALRQLPGVELVSLGDPDRALIAFRDGLTMPAFELRVQDLLDGPVLPAEEAEVISQLAALLRDVRRTAGRSLSEATIVVLEDARLPVARLPVRGRGPTRPGRASPSRTRA